MVTTVKEGQQNIQGLLPDGTLIPINLSVQDGKPVAEEVLPELDFKLTKDNSERNVSRVLIKTNL